MRDEDYYTSAPTPPVYVYILECADGTLYTGWTVNLTNRVRRHQQGKGAKYTRSRLPVKCVWSWPLRLSTQARRIEAAIKKMKRSQKLKLISGEIDFVAEFEPNRL